MNTNKQTLKRTIAYLSLILYLSISWLTLAPQPVFAQTTTAAYDDWESTTLSGGVGWLDTSWSFTGTVTANNALPYAGTHSLRLTGLSSMTSAAWRRVNLSGYTGVRLQFWWRSINLDSGEFARVFINNGTSTQVWQAANLTTYSFVDIDLSGYAMTANFEIRISTNANLTDEHVYIDELVVIGVRTDQSVPSGCVNNPPSTPASGWTSIDIGGAPTGYTGQYANQSIYVCGSGKQLWDKVDQLRYVYRSFSTDVEIVAQVTAWNPVNEWSKAGLMIRDTTAAGARHASIMVTGNNGIRLQHRTTANSTTTDVAGPASFTVPVWLRINRTGTTVRAFYSTNGIDWLQVGSSVTLSLGSPFLVGMFVSSRNNTAWANITFSSVSVSNTLAPTGNRWGQFDNFELCPLTTSAFGVRPKPPGLMECASVLSNANFEDSVFGEPAPWVIGTDLAAQIRSSYSCDVDGNTKGPNAGNYSLWLKDDREWYPPYIVLNPWAYQDFIVPTFVTSTENIEVFMNLSLYYVVQPPFGVSLPPGSGGRTDGRAQDWLEALVTTPSGTPLSGRAFLARGNQEPRGTFLRATADLAPLFFNGGMNAFKNYAGQTLRLRIEANNDDQQGDSRFYIDQIRCEICYRVKEPPPVAGLVRKIGGLAQVLLPSGVKTEFQGIDVWAMQMQTGDPPQPALNELDFQSTYTIQNSTYSFYNLKPGKYRIYAEFWYGGNLYSASAIVDNLTAGEERTLPDLLLIGIKN